MDPVRGLIHLGLKVTEATLDRTLNVVRLADTLLVATAMPAVREPDTGERVWPEEEQGDLDALSATLRARAESSETAAASPPRPSAAKKSAGKKPAARKKTAAHAPAKKAPAKKAPAKKAVSTASTKGATAAKSAPAKKASAAKKTTQKKAASAKATTKEAAPSTTAATKKAPAKKTAGAQTLPRASTTVRATETPTLMVLPDA